jgi:hypothetical protein
VKVKMPVGVSVSRRSSKNWKTPLRVALSNVTRPNPGPPQITKPSQVPVSCAWDAVPIPNSTAPKKIDFTFLISFISTNVFVPAPIGTPANVSRATGQRKMLAGRGTELRDKSCGSTHFLVC